MNTTQTNPLHGPDAPTLGAFQPALMTFHQLSDYISMGRTQVYRLINLGDLPGPLKFGKASRWSRTEVDSWLASRAAAKVRQ